MSVQHVRANPSEVGSGGRWLLSLGAMLMYSLN